MNINQTNPKDIAPIIDVINEYGGNLTKYLLYANINNLQQLWFINVLINLKICAIDGDWFMILDQTSYTLLTDKITFGIIE